MAETTMGNCTNDGLVVSSDDNFVRLILSWTLGLVMDSPITLYFLMLSDVVGRIRTLVAFVQLTLLVLACMYTCYVEKNNLGACIHVGDLHEQRGTK